jgi:hypothetical protein
MTQADAMWFDMSAFQDVVAWLDVKEVNAGGGTAAIQLAYQTAPIKDESLFVAVTTAISPLATGLTVTRMLKNFTTNPPTRWLRWQLTVTGTPTSAWDATFRIIASANSPPCRQMMMPARPVLPADLSLRGEPTLPAMVPPSPPLHLLDLSFAAPRPPGDRGAASEIALRRPLV